MAASPPAPRSGARAVRGRIAPGRRQRGQVAGSGRIAGRIHRTFGRVRTLPGVTSRTLPQTRLRRARRRMFPRGALLPGVAGVAPWRPVFAVVETCGRDARAPRPRLRRGGEARARPGGTPLRRTSAGLDGPGGVRYTAARVSSGQGRAVAAWRAARAPPTVFDRRLAPAWRSCYRPASVPRAGGREGP